MHSVSALCFSQQKRFCKPSTIYASLHLDNFFSSFIRKGFWQHTLLYLINDLELLTFRSKRISEFNNDWLLLWGQDEWFNYAPRPLICPSCLLLRVINEDYMYHFWLRSPMSECIFILFFLADRVCLQSVTSCTAGCGYRLCFLTVRLGIGVIRLHHRLACGLFPWNTATIWGVIDQALCWDHWC